MGLVSEDPRMIAGERSLCRGRRAGPRRRGRRRRRSCSPPRAARATVSSQLTASTMGRCSRLPAEARTHLPDQGSTLSPAKITQSAPAASAVRTTVPALPGSRASTSTTTSRWPGPGGRRGQRLGQPDPRQVGDGDQPLRGDGLRQRRGRVVGHQVDGRRGRQPGEQRRVPLGRRRGREHLADDAGLDRRAHRRRALRAAPAPARGDRCGAAACARRRPGRCGRRAPALAQCREPQAAGAA